MLLGLGDYRDNSTSPKESYNLMVQQLSHSTTTQLFYCSF